MRFKHPQTQHMLVKLLEATLHGNGYWLLPMCEKIHSLLNIATILTNKAPFFGKTFALMIKVLWPH